MKDKAIIFDMDGVLVDNTVYHVKAWQIYLEKLGFDFSARQIKERFHGRTNTAIFNEIFGGKLPGGLIRKYAQEKEALYRKLYKGKVKALPGLKDFLKILKKSKVSTALATSAPAKNVSFVLNNLGIGKYFQKILDPLHVKHGKPHPEIYLLAAKSLGVKPSQCIVFEDTKFGIEAAKRAGMKVVAVTTTHTPKELKGANLYIKDFSLGARKRILKLINSL